MLPPVLFASGGTVAAICTVIRKQRKLDRRFSWARDLRADRLKRSVRTKLIDLATFSYVFDGEEFRPLVLDSSSKELKASIDTSRLVGRLSSAVGSRMDEGAVMRQLLERVSD